MSDTETLEKPKKSRAAPAAPGAMRVTVERAALLAALADVQAVVERRSTIPILANVKLEAADGALTLTGTDLLMEVRQTVPSAIAAPGVTTVSADLLHGIVREMPGGAQIELSADGGKLSVAAGRARYRLHSLPGEDFPAIGCNEMRTAFALPASLLRSTMAKLAHAQSTEELRYYLNGVVLQVDARDGEALTAAATDGNCLAAVSLPLPEGAAGMPEVIVPRKTVSQLLRLLDGRDGDVAITLSATRLRFELGGTTLISKAVEGNYPDWRRVVPTQSQLVLHLHAETLDAGIRRVTAVATEKVRGVKLAIDRDLVTLSVTSVEHGTAADEIPAAYDGRPLEVGFNARFVQNTLRAMGMAEVEIRLADAAAPALFTNPADPTARWVVMPMRL